MIAAEKDRKITAAGHLQSSLGQTARPSHQSIEVLHCGIGVTEFGFDRRRRISEISDGPAQFRQSSRQAGSPKRIGPHQASGLGCAALNGAPRIWHVFNSFSLRRREAFIS